MGTANTGISAGVLDIGRTGVRRTLAWQHGLVSMRQQGWPEITIMLVEHPPVLQSARTATKRIRERGDRAAVH